MVLLLVVSNLLGRDGAKESSQNEGGCFHFKLVFKKYFKISYLITIKYCFINIENVNYQIHFLYKNIKKIFTIKLNH